MITFFSIFFHIFAVSLLAYTGSAQALFYDMSVEQTRWLRPQDFANFLGFGFATPGPQVFSLGTFIGYGAGGIVGALIGTIAIYIAPITLSIFVGRYLRRWIEKDYAYYFIRSVGICATGLLIAIGVKIFGQNHISVVYAAIAVLAFIASTRKINPLFIIIFGLLGGLFLH